MTSRGTTSYAWTALGQLTAVTISGQAIRNYTYDAFGRRVSTKVGSAETQYLYHGWHMIGAYDLFNSQWLWQEIPMSRGEGMLEHVALDTNDLDGDSNATEYRSYAVQEDWQDTVWALSGSSGVVIERYVQDDPFGKTHTEDANGQNLGDFASQVYHGKRMHGGVTEEATGLYDFRNRWYAPMSGGWLSRDPLGLVDSPNLYQNAWGNNLVNSDSSGLFGTRDFPCPGNCFANYNMATLKAKCEGLSANSPCKEACDALKAAMKSCGKSARKLQHCVNRQVKQEWNNIGRGNRAAYRLGAAVTSIALGRNISVKNVLRGGAIIICKARLGGRSRAGIGDNGAVGSAYDQARADGCSAASRVAACTGTLPAGTIR